MAIEPLSSAMTYQAQTSQQAKPVQKTVVENTEVATPEQSKVYDATTVKVAEAQKQDGKNEQDGKNGQDGTSANQQASNEQIKKAVEQLNKNMPNSEAIFGIHDATNRVTIKIVDKQTKEVIKELPPEKTLDMIAKAWELAGLLVDERR
ncbi:MAG: flagellar protein FlaG [Bacillota bacterium]|nr:flagellar protein FlaG [Bacillota bacterium]